MIAAVAADARHFIELSATMGGGHSAYGLHMAVLWICVAIWVIVFAVMFHSIIVHRRSRGADSARFHDTAPVEMAWTILPFLILVLMAVPATRKLLQAQEGQEPVAGSEASSDAPGNQMRRGAGIYAQQCAMCHMPGGEGVPGAYPALKGSAIVTGPVEVLLDRVINGTPGTSMAAFGARLNDEDLAAVCTYVRNTWGKGAKNAGEPCAVGRFKANR